MKLLTRKYKYATKYATNLLLGVLCAYSVCACDNVKQITPNDTQSDNERPDNGQYEPNPTDTDQDKQDNQEHQETPDNQWEQPDENHNENPDNQWEQPDENHNENPDNQWEQPDQDHNENPDNQWEQPDQDHNENPNDQDNQWEQPDENHQETPDEQNNEGKCDPGYVWSDFDVQPVLSEYGFVDKQCVACNSIPDLAQALENGNRYCPGGDDLKGKRVFWEQISKCPQYTYVNADYSDCVCTYGVPPPGEECKPGGYMYRKKPLIISPKVNVISNHRNVNRLMLMRTKIRKAKTR